MRFKDTHMYYINPFSSQHFSSIRVSSVIESLSISSSIMNTSFHLPSSPPHQLTFEWVKTVIASEWKIRGNQEGTSWEKESN